VGVTWIVSGVVFLALAVTDLGAPGGIPIGQLTPAGLLFIIILLIASGRLVPRRTMEDVIHDRNEWRTAHRISEQSRAEQNEMVKELLEHARTTDAFIRSIQSVAQHRPPEADHSEGG
jgi:hypothetical protein